MVLKKMDDELIETGDKKIKDFFKDARMFFIKENNVFVCFKESNDNHENWISKIISNSEERKNVINNCVKGYINEKRIYFFQEKYKVVDKIGEESFFNNLKKIIDFLKLDKDVEIYGGVKITEEKVSYVKGYGSIKENINVII